MKGIIVDSQIEPLIDFCIKQISYLQPILIISGIGLMTINQLHWLAQVLAE